MLLKLVSALSLSFVFFLHFQLALFAAAAWLCLTLLSIELCAYASWSAFSVELIQRKRESERVKHSERSVWFKSNSRLVSIWRALSIEACALKLVAFIQLHMCYVTIGQLCAQPLFSLSSLSSCCVQWEPSGGRIKVSWRQQRTKVHCCCCCWLNHHHQQQQKQKQNKPIQVQVCERHHQLLAANTLSSAQLRLSSAWTRFQLSFFDQFLPNLRPKRNWFNTHTHRVHCYSGSRQVSLLLLLLLLCLIEIEHK